MFTWTGTPLRTREQIAREVHQVSLNRGLDELATVIALMAISTEVGTGSGDQRIWWCPANPVVRDSVSFPHDSLSNDSRSMGYLQQQAGPNGEPWWGTTADMMTLETAADTFLSRLDSGYEAAVNDPRMAGRYAQNVQQSSYPDRYADKWNEAWEVLNRALAQPNTGELMADIHPVTYYDVDRSNDFTFGSSRNTANIVGICIHDTEGVTSANATNQTANNVTDYQISSRTGSYHVMVGVDGQRIRQNTDNWATWSTGNKGNDILLHLCFVGSASQSRADWLAQDTMLRAGATVIRYWADKYQIPLRRVDAAHLPGILGHVDTRVWGGTDHTDPGVDFPYDVLIQYATDLDAHPTAPEPESPLMALTDTEQHELLAKTRDIWDQLRGPSGNGWPQLNDRTPIDALADIALHQGIPGYAPPRKTS